MAILTVSQQFASGGQAIAGDLAERTGFSLVARDTVEEIMRAEYGVDPVRLRRGTDAFAGARSDSGEDAPATDLLFYSDLLAAIVADLAAAQDIVLLGCGGQFLFADTPCAMSVRVVAPRPWRAARAAAEMGLAPPAAAELVARRDAEQARYVRAVFGRSAMQSELYHLTLNTAALDTGQAVDLALAAFDNLGLREAGLLPPRGADRLKVRSNARLHPAVPEPEPVAPSAQVMFAHPSERLFARLMDFYGIRWAYEPRTFPLDWNDRNEVSEAFTPDFYLPEMDLYVELTTMKQSLVTRKNRKVKRIRQLYPGVNIRIFYQKDVEDLIFKLGASRDLTAVLH